MAVSWFALTIHLMTGNAGARLVGAFGGMTYVFLDMHQDIGKQERLSNLYEQLRLKLLDLSRRNPMLNYRLGARSKRHLQIVDEVPEEIYRLLVGEEQALKIAFLRGTRRDYPGREDGRVLLGFGAREGF
jgi:hypothetical protein